MGIKKVNVFNGKWLEVVLQNCAPRRGRKHNFEKCDSKNDLEHNKYQNLALQIGFSMQVYNIGHEIYKNVGVMHAVVFAEGGREAKIAQVVGENHNFNGFKKRKNSDQNGQKSEKSKSNDKKCSYRRRLGVKKVKILIENA